MMCIPSSNVRAGLGGVLCVLLLLSPSRTRAAGEPATTASSAANGASLTIKSITPASPAALKAGERLQIAIEYHYDQEKSVHIWARPFTNGRSTSGYRAHPSPPYPKGTGTAEGWFYFDSPTQVDEVRVTMSDGGREPIATASLPIKAVWTGTRETPAKKVTAANWPPVNLKEGGAFGFPQKQARVLCDSPDLRFSVAANGEYLFAQAVVWNDGDASLGKTGDGRDIGDWSNLGLELGERGKVTPKVERTYALNPWPALPGLRYQISVSENGWTGLQGDSKGRGSIQYLTQPDGKKVRVDSYLVPLEEIGKKGGDMIRLTYWGSSPEPALTVNSVGYDGRGRTYYNYNLPRDSYHDYTLPASGVAIDAAKLPEGRNERVPAVALENVTKPSPVRGTTPEIKFTAVDGREVDLAKMKGKVVLIDFWATWCGPCMAEVPHVVEAYQKLHDKGFEVVGISFDQDKEKLERVTKEKGMTWPQYFDGKGWKNAFGVKYGIHGIPEMWLVNKQGKVVTTNARRDLAAQVEKLLAE